MVYGVIDNKSFPYYTYLCKVFNAIGNECKKNHQRKGKRL